MLLSCRVVILSYSDVSEMGTYWSGSDYDSFKDGTDGYKNALSDLGNSLRMYGKQFEKLSEGTDELSKKLIDIVDTCTTRNVD